ncbi:hypothetical protein [Amycolatopsis anabasis]|uniref:hypothetical protein n=1 Tax=Amycolatopsis anabasis TaxID=1840409 RepID=UPI00131DB763|nr:hypothetical protein [Amycolatopsis anabasis]
MRDRELRRRCRRLLRELAIVPPLDVRVLCERVGRRRGKPIHPVARPIPVPGPFGAWISTRAADYILYQQETSKSHQDHIILHELGHILAGHPSDSPGADVEQLCPDFGPDAVRRALRRTAYDTEQEREAETVATIILEWASVLDRISPRPSGEAPAQRMEAALADRLGWL